MSCLRVKGITFTLLLNQFKDFMVLVLMGATLVSGLLGEYLDAITIIAIILLNGVLGFVQEFRAERSLRALKQLSAPTAKVIRGGKQEVLPARMLVPGDIVLLESGDRIPADVRWLQCSSIYAEESALTGSRCRSPSMPRRSMLKTFRWAIRRISASWVQW